MRIIVAPDSFKGSLSSVAVVNAMEQGIKVVFADAEVVKVPIADGGEGTVEALVSATGGKIITQKVEGPLGESVEAYWGLLGDGETAVIEMAAASGLTLVPKTKLNPRVATTFGTGQLIMAALDRNVRKIIVGIGGSATNDGGAGMCRALGAKFLDASGCELPNGGAALKNLARIDLDGFDSRIAKTQILVACDVDNPLCGQRGATAVYGPQKGVTPDMLHELDEALQRYAMVAKEATGKDVAESSGAGAAGGLGAGLMFFTNAELRPGVDVVLETVGFDELVEKASFVITGEGATDFQTAHGKAPVGVAKAAAKYNVPTVCLSGGLGDGCDAVLEQGIAGIMSIVPRPMALEDCMQNAAQFVQDATSRLCYIIRMGLNLTVKR